MAGRKPPRKSYSELPPEAQEAAVRERCIRLLSAQSRTRAQLERALVREGAPQAVVDQVLERFTAVGLIDDAAYAQAFMRTGLEVRKRGSRSLRAELVQRGVSAEVIEAAGDEIDPQAEHATALALATRRAASWARLDPRVRRQRLTGLLLRRGFSAATVRSVIAEVLEMEAGGFAGEELAEPAFALDPDCES